MSIAIKPKKQTYTENNEYKKVCRNISFAYQKGHEALDWLEQHKNELDGGKSAYVIKLLLEDKARKAKNK